MKLDHIMYASNKLSTGISEIERLSGVEPIYGGAHANTGTCNALMSFGPSQYFEVIAPDDNQDISGTMGEELSNMSKSKIRTWAVTMHDHTETIAIIETLGYRYKVIDMSRTRTDGVHLSWKILFVLGHPFGNLMPFFIDWLQSLHPAENTPRGCSLSDFTVQLQDNHTAYAAAMNKFDIAVNVKQGENALIATIDSRKGLFELR